MVNSNNIKTCLIVAPSWVGDMVMAQSLFKILIAQNPELKIDVLAPAWCSALTDYMPEVNRLIEAPFAHGALNFGRRWQLAKGLKGQYDVAYVLPNSLKSALVPWLAKIPRRIGFLGEQRYGLLNQRHLLNKQKLPLMVQRFVALAKEVGAEPAAKADIPAPHLRVDRHKIEQTLQQYELTLSDASRVLVLCPGAEFGAAKQWPEEHYAAVARFYIDAGWQVWLFGSEKDFSTCAAINKLSHQKCHNLAGKTSLSDAIALLAAADLVVSNDSGLMHVAAALQKPLVAIYGSTDPSFTPPLNHNARIERLGLDCSPCFKRDCPLGHLDCLKKLPPRQILAAAETLLGV